MTDRYEVVNETRIKDELAAQASVVLPDGPDLSALVLKMWILLNKVDGGDLSGQDPEWNREVAELIDVVSAAIPGPLGGQPS